MDNKCYQVPQYLGLWVKRLLFFLYEHNYITYAAIKIDKMNDLH